jgi:hypothetical protein
MKWRCPACGTPGVPLIAKFRATTSRPAVCSRCGSYVAPRPSPGLDLTVALVEQALAFVAVLALLLALGSLWWLVVLPMVFIPRFLLDVSTPLVAVSVEQRTAAVAVNRELLRAAGFVVLIGTGMFLIVKIFEWLF